MKGTREAVISFGLFIKLGVGTIVDVPDFSSTRQWAKWYLDRKTCVALVASDGSKVGGKLIMNRGMDGK